MELAWNPNGTLVEPSVFFKSTFIGNSSIISTAYPPPLSRRRLTTPSHRILTVLVSRMWSVFLFFRWRVGGCFISLCNFLFYYYYYYLNGRCAELGFLFMKLDYERVLWNFVHSSISKFILMFSYYFTSIGRSLVSIVFSQSIFDSVVKLNFKSLVISSTDTLAVSFRRELLKIKNSEESLSNQLSFNFTTEVLWKLSTK